MSALRGMLIDINSNYSTVIGVGLLPGSFTSTARKRSLAIQPMISASLIPERNPTGVRDMVHQKNGVGIVETSLDDVMKLI
jgi:hypothetical protein